MVKLFYKEILNALFEVRKRVPITFKSWMFQLPPNKETGLKILTPKQMLQTLPILLAKVKEINLSENLLNETRQIKYFLY